MKSFSLAELKSQQTNGLLEVADAITLIEAGLPLSIAGPESAMDMLPSGNWIGGTTPYFMTVDGGRVITEGQVFVTDLSRIGSVRVATYDANRLADISGNGPEHGFSLAIIPAGSACHEQFAHDAADYPQAFLRPTVGWIAGVDLADAAASAKVYDGTGPTKHTDQAVVAHISQPEDALLSIEIVNPFTPGDGDVLRFEETDFAPTHCIVGGQPTNFAAYLVEHGMDDGTLPLIGDFAGAPINVSIKSVDRQTQAVTLYAPVFPGVDYRFAAPLADYAATFREKLADHSFEGAMWSCNCILNFLYGALEGKAIGGIAGPVTFGEIAYQLLNQTMVLVRQNTPDACTGGEGQ
ncbi:MAG: hypothetical protein WCS75_14585 [Sphingomonas sp.]|uniref:DUF6976 family protein n=1 Tax=Sphingomonas sp. TaxID=28214 RepID=UPI00356A0728